MARALDLERANAARDRYVEVTTSVAAPLVSTGRSPRDVPSICEATVGGEGPLADLHSLEAALDGGSALNLGFAL
jgi:hypothetical protein